MTTYYAANPTETSTVAEHVLGTLMEDRNGTVWRYCKAGAALTAFEAQAILPTWTTDSAALTTTTTSSGTKVYKIGWPQVAVPNGSYFWAATGGSFTAKAALNCAGSTRLYTTSTAGVMDDATASVYEIKGVVLVATITTAAATACFSTAYEVSL